MNRNKYPRFKSEYTPVYSCYNETSSFLGVRLHFTSNSCPTSVSASHNGNIVIVGYSDDSLVLRDVRSKFEDKIRLEVGGHQNSVKSIVFSERDADVLCLTGGSDNKLKLWDLRQKRCIRDYGGQDNYEQGSYHTNSIWSICPTSTFEACFTGGKDGSIFHTDLVGDEHTKVFQ